VKERIIQESQGDNDIIVGRFSNQYGSLFFDRQPGLFEGMNEFKIKRHDNGLLFLLIRIAIGYIGYQTVCIDNIFLLLSQFSTPGRPGPKV
jgi:hypothetical protein